VLFGGATGRLATALRLVKRHQAVGVMCLLSDMVGEHQVNTVAVALGDLHAGGAHFVNSRVGVFFHILVPSKSTGVSNIGMGRPSRSLTSRIWSSLSGLARWMQVQVSRKLPVDEAAAPGIMRSS
jgi:hypothetical protein